MPIATAGARPVAPSRAHPVAHPTPLRYPRPMTPLPRWVVSDRESIEREAAPYRGLSPQERWRLTAAACRAAARQLASRPDRERLLAYRDPLPPESVAAFARLRAAYRGRS